MQCNSYNNKNTTTDEPLYKRNQINDRQSQKKKNIDPSMYIQPYVFELGFAPQRGILLLYVSADGTL